jgi:UDP-N-acetylglucosamine pyrophosphorylase
LFSKVELFVFFRKFFIWEVRRDDEFSPLKNGSGTKDTPVTCRRDLMLQHVRWLQAAGAILPSNIAKQIILYEDLFCRKERKRIFSFFLDQINFMIMKAILIPTLWKFHH